MRILPLFFLCILLAPWALPAAETVHVVQKNETLYGIARSYGVSLDALIKANGIDDPKNLKAGAKLRIPDSHMVRKGDTLYKIAKDYGTTVDTLRTLNGLGPDAVIKPGELLLLPAAKTAAKAEGDAADAEDLPQNGDEVRTANAAEEDGGASAKPSPSAAVPAEPDAVSGSHKTAGAESGGNAPVEDGLWPITGERIVSDGQFSGTRIIGSRGDSVLCVNDGRVIWEGPYRGFGRVIIVESGDEYIYVYAGNETSLVQVGDHVRPRMEIARLGTNPHEGKAVMFFSVFKDGKPIDPHKAPRGL